MPGLQLKVSVYADYSAKKELAMMALTPKTILDDVSGIFTHINGIPFSYNLKFLPVMHWRHDIHTELARFSLLNGNTDTCDEQSIILDEARIEKEIVRAYKAASTDVIFFFSGIVSCGNGLVPDYYFERGAGIGPILIGVRGARFRERRRIGRMVLDRCVAAASDVASLRQYLQEISGVCAHEQGHLFGLDHSESKSSLMHKFSNHRQRKFDQVSLEILRKRIDYLSSANPA